MRNFVCTFAVVLGVVASTFAGDAYLLRFKAVPVSTLCHATSWHDEVLLYNTSPTPATIRLLGSSAAPLPTGIPTEVLLPPRQVVSLDVATGFRWRPQPQNDTYQMWAVHLDVPAGVVIDSRNAFQYDWLGCVSPHLSQGYPLGKVSLPVYRALVPANVPQSSIGTDLGERTERLNVTIYNAGAVEARANIEIRRGCDESLADERTVTIPANSVVQFTGLKPGADTCEPSVSRGIARHIRYTTVTVDQPSVSYVSVIGKAARADDPTKTLPVVELAVALNAVY